MSLKRGEAVLGGIEGLPKRERLLAMTGVLIAVALATLDTAIVNTALPTIARDLQADAASTIWVVSAYQIAMVASLLPLAALGEILGHRRICLAGLVLFTATSLACGLAWSLPSLVAARVLQGLGAAAVMSVNTALIRFIYPARMLGRGLGANALTVGVAFTVGPTVASAILSVASWHWLFLVNVPIGVFALGLGLRALPATLRSAHGFDPVAAVLSAAFFALFIFGVGEFSHGAAWPRIALELAAAFACGVALIRRQAGHPAPMLSVDLFRLPIFALSAATAVCAFATQGLAFVALPFLLQNVLGHSQVETGFLMTPWPAIVAVMAPIAGRLSDRYAPGMLGGLGLSVLSFGMAALAFMPHTPDRFGIAWRLALCGAGFGFYQSPNLRALMGSAPPNRSGGASGIVATARLVGQSVGAALVALCLTLSPANGPALALGLGSVFAGIGCIASFMRLLPPRGN